MNGREVGRTPITGWTCDDEDEGGGPGDGDEAHDWLWCILNAADFLVSAGFDVTGAWAVKAGVRAAASSRFAWSWALAYWEGGRKLAAGSAAIASGIGYDAARDAAYLRLLPGTTLGNLAVAEDLVFANNPNHMPSTTFGDFLKDVAPIWGSLRAWDRATTACVDAMIGR